MPDETRNSGMDRRDALKTMGLLPFVTAWDFSAPQLERAARAFEPTVARSAYAPAFFTQPDWETVRLLADYVIPRDERSGSATDAKASGIESQYASSRSVQSSVSPPSFTVAPGHGAG